MCVIAWKWDTAVLLSASSGSFPVKLFMPFLAYTGSSNTTGLIGKNRHPGPFSCTANAKKQIQVLIPKFHSHTQP